MDFLMLLSTRMRTANMRCTILNFYIYLPVLSKWWHEIVTAVRIMPWRGFWLEHRKQTRKTSAFLLKRLIDFTRMR